HAEGRGLPRLRRRARRAQVALRKELLRLRELPELQVRGMGPAHPWALPAVREAVSAPEVHQARRRIHRLSRQGMRVPARSPRAGDGPIRPGTGFLKTDGKKRPAVRPGHAHDPSTEPTVTAGTES